MSDEPQTPQAGDAGRPGAVARLAEALASAQRVAREVDREPAETPTDPSADAAGPNDVPGEAAGPADVPGEAAGPADVPDEADTPDGSATRVGDPDPHHNGPDRPTPHATPTATPPRPANRTRRLWPLHVAMGLLVVAVPVLAYVGYRLTSDSTSGEVLSGRAEPDAPGYLALVEPTPVALVMHTADDGTAQGLTILSLSGPDHDGGVVIGVPVDMDLTKSFYAIRDFAGTIEQNRPETAAKVIGQTLGLGFTEAVRMTDAELIRFVEPAGPLTLDNPETVTTTDGVTYDAGPLELTADRVPAYLTASDAGDTLSGSLARQELFWSAWVAAIAASEDPAVIPGERTVGLGRFLDGLAAGNVQTASFPVRPADRADTDDPDADLTYQVDRGPANLLIANAVPFPVGAGQGDRATVALLNGTGPESAPPAVIQRLTYAGAQITTTGNARTFDHDQTVLTYAGPAHRAAAQRMVDELGVGRVEAADSDQGTDIRVVMGADLLDDPPEPLTAQEVTTP